MDQKARPSTFAGLACGIAASLFWAAGYGATRHGLDVGFSPAELTIHRCVWPGLALLPIAVRAGIVDLNGVGWIRGLLLALLGGPGFVFISFSGFLLVPLGHAGVIQPSSATLGGLVLAGVLLGERLSVRRVFGAVVIVCGLIVIAVEAISTIGMHGVVGDLVFILTGLMYASFGLLLRLWRIDPLSGATAVSVVSLLIVPALWAFIGFEHMIALGWRQNFLQILFQGILAGPVALYLFARSVALLGVGRAVTVLSLVPAFILLIGWVALGTQPTILQFSGLAIVLIGFRFVQL